MYSVVVIDDDAFVRSTVKKLLESEGFDVSLALNVESGWECCVRLKPDAVIVDVGLPDGNGMDLCIRIKGDPRLSGIPIMVLTGEAVSIDERAQALDAGADDYLLKPFDTQELILRLRRLLV